MNRILIFISILLSCCSCSIYQYNVLSSSTPGIEDQPFTFENDSIRVSYYFDDGRSNVEIFNKSLKPLYVDWSRSSLIVNGEARSYWNGESVVNLQSTEYRSVINAAYKNGTITGTISSGTPVTFLPPDSKTRSTSIGLPGVWQTMKASEKFKRFSEDDTPLKFRSYLMLSRNQDFSNPIQMDHHFWLAEVHQYNQEPKITPRQNAWMSSKLSEGGTVAVGMVAIAGMIGVIIISSDNIPPTARAGQ